jgi:hypothetical protein
MLKLPRWAPLIQRCCRSNVIEHRQCHVAYITFAALRPSTYNGRFRISACAENAEALLVELQAAPG